MSGPEIARSLALVALVAASTALGGTLLGNRPTLAAVRPNEGEGRIVSLALPSDEILLTLMEPSAIVAVSSFAADPSVSSVARRAAEVPLALRGTAESVLALEPTVVFTSSFHDPAEEALLRRAGLRIERVPFVASFDEIEENVRHVARVVGRDEGAEALVQTMRERIAEVEARVRDAPRPRVLLLQTGGYTAGLGTLFDEEVRIAGGINAASSAGIEGHATISIERAASLDPDVIVTIDYRADARSRDVLGVPEVLDTPGLSTLRAVREHRVVELTPRVMMSTSHFAVDAVVELARALHPDRMAP